MGQDIKKACDRADWDAHAKRGSAKKEQKDDFEIMTPFQKVFEKESKETLFKQNLRPFKKIKMSMKNS